MLPLRNRILSAVRAASQLPASASLHRHLLLSFSTAAASPGAPSPAPFFAADYLVTTCGLTPAQALKSSKYLAHVKSRSNADAVLAFLTGAGLTKADVAAAIAKQPDFLCSKVDKTLSPRIGMLRDIGLSPAQISSLITVVPNILRVPTMIRRLQFFLSFLGSFEKVHIAIKRSAHFLCRDVERLFKPNISFLRQCGLTDCDIVKICHWCPQVVILEPERLKEIVMCVDKLGVPRDSAMFKHAIVSVYSISPERIGARSDFFKETLGCSETELSIAWRKLPQILRSTADKLRRTVKFLKMEVGLNAEYIVHRPALLTYSLKKRLIPRHYVLNFLKEKGLLKKDLDFYYVISLTEKKFAKMFLDPYKEAVPGLAAAYGEQIAPEIKP